MSFPLYHAVQFRGPMERGLTQPFMVIGRPAEGGADQLLVVKARAGYGDSPESMIRECLATHWARLLGLEVPEPVIVDIPGNFHEFAQDFPSHASIIKDSIGLNYATLHLGTDWKTWTATTPPQKVEKQILETIYSFDGVSFP